MSDSDQYLKTVEWSDEDQCYVGTSPGLFYGGCHGDDEQQVFAELCQIVDESAGDSQAGRQAVAAADGWARIC